jgi:lysophospholipase L1-like esterase
MPGGTGSGGSDTGGSTNPGTGGAGSGGSSTGSGGSTVTGTGGAETGGTGIGTGGAVGSGGTATGGSGGGTTGGATGSGGRGTGGVATGSGGVGPGGSGGAAGSTVGEVPLDASLLSRCTGTNPIRCTIPVPTDGNYNVTVELGSATAASTSRIQSELFRIEVQPVTLSVGMYSKQTFSVNVRAEKHDGYMAVGKVLDLLIDGSAPALHGVGFASAPNIPTIFVAGDSTVCDWDPALASINDPNQRGWAQGFSQYLKPGMAMADYADSGETAGSFYTKFFVPQARDAMRPGDYLFVQFGHNDQKAQADIDAYTGNLMKYVSDAKGKGATPVLFTPLARKGATLAAPGFGGLDQKVRDLATSQQIAIVDLTKLAIAYYGTVANTSTLFGMGDSTHPSETGSTQISGVVAKDLKAGTLPLRDLLK